MLFIEEVNKVKLRSSFIIAACAAALAAAPAWAQFKPTKPVELIVHTGPGGGADVRVSRSTTRPAAAA